VDAAVCRHHRLRHRAVGQLDQAQALTPM
jgi:hypothetical protein